MSEVVLYTPVHDIGYSSIELRIHLSFYSLFSILDIYAQKWFYFQELSMEALGLSSVPSEVWESSEVIKVDLTRNSIEELPIELSSCTHLQVNVFVQISVFSIVVRKE